MSMQNTASVQKHRAKLAAEGCMRVEMVLNRKFTQQAREFARQRGMPFWYLVEQALLAYAATGKADETTNRK